MIKAEPDFLKILKGSFIPTIIDSDAAGSAVGMFGAVIMPHNIYLHSALVLTRKINMKSKDAINEANIYNNIESAISLFISFVITLAVVSTFAVYVERYGKPDEDWDLRQGSDALVTLLGGDWAKYVWAIGLLAAG